MENSKMKKIGNILIVIGVVVILAFIIIGIIDAVDAAGDYTKAMNELNESDFEVFKKYVLNGDSKFEHIISTFIYWLPFAIPGLACSIVGLVLKKKAK